MQDFRAELLKQDEPEAKEIALAIELFTHGSLNTFAKPTNVDTDNRLICYDILDLGKQLMPIGMLAELERQCDILKHNIADLADCQQQIENIFSEQEFDEAYSLPEPNKLESAKSYRIRIEPLFSKLKEFAKRYLIKFIDYRNKYRDVSSEYNYLQRENYDLKQLNTKYLKENKTLRNELKDFRLLKKVLGKERIAKIIEQSRKSKKHERNC